jgi:diguanylate cyclase (GGDEF)-like protein
MHHDARTDALTGLHNRRAIQERAVLELKRAERSGQPVSVLLCDIDRFKSINDRHGHEAGDAILKAVARVLKSAVREIDALGRWGGEEFIAVLSNADASQAAEIAERMRAAVAAASFDAVPHGITVSLGVSTCTSVDGVAAAWAVLLKEADANLYRAKSEGRNRVVAG